MEVNRIILFFDGVCNLCNGFIQFILKRNSKKNIYFATLQSENSILFLKDKGVFLKQMDTLIVFSDNDILRRSQAVLKLCAQLDLPWRLLVIFKIFPTYVLDFFYAKLAERRYKLFGKRDSCMVPSEETKSRFI